MDSLRLLSLREFIHRMNSILHHATIYYYYLFGICLLSFLLVVVIRIFVSMDFTQPRCIQTHINILPFFVDSTDHKHFERANIMNFLFLVLFLIFSFCPFFCHVSSIVFISMWNEKWVFSGMDIHKNLWISCGFFRFWPLSQCCCVFFLLYLVVISPSFHAATWSFVSNSDVYSYLREMCILQCSCFIGIWPRWKQFISECSFIDERYFDFFFYKDHRALIS